MFMQTMGYEGGHGDAKAHTEAMFPWPVFK